VIGAMTMGVGGALMEELAVDKRHGFFVNHDLASYEVPVHADIPHRRSSSWTRPTDVFADEGQGRGRTGLCGVAPPLPTPSTTPPACACVTTRSPSTSCSRGW
jgi:xanthine dehydrogenase YagR molybdenum-binding subunit